MKPEAYLEMARVEGEHWWFRGRRTIVESLIENMDLPASAQILEAGCGTGGNLRLLSRFGEVSAFDMSETACAFAREQCPAATVRQGHCPDDIPYPDARFDLICLLDVLEHLERDDDALVALGSKLAGGGRLLLTVPAYPMLWSSHDEFLHHHRRYRATQLTQLLDHAGFSVERVSHFNTLLFPVAALSRLAARLSNTPAGGTGVPVKMLNAALYKIFAAERMLLSRTNLPFGVSLVAIGRTRR